MIECCNPE